VNSKNRFALLEKEHSEEEAASDCELSSVESEDEPLRPLPDLTLRPGQGKWKSSNAFPVSTARAFLCRECESLFNPDRPNCTYDNFYPHHQRRALLEKSMKHRCRICILLWDKVISHRIQILPSDGTKHDWLSTDGVYFTYSKRMMLIQRMIIFPSPTRTKSEGT
jgi:hypothetical protein